MTYDNDATRTGIIPRIPIIDGINEGISRHTHTQSKDTKCYEPILREGVPIISLTSSYLDHLDQE